MKLTDYFDPAKGISRAQRQYEAVRAVAFEEGTLKEIAKRFGYKPNSLKTIVAEVRAGRYSVFPKVKPGPKKRHIKPEIIERVIKLRRNRRLSSKEISDELNKEGYVVSGRTIQRVLQDAGFPRLRRRTYKERGITKKGALLSERSRMLEVPKLEPVRVECKVAGLFFFIPYIIESGLLEIVKSCPLPGSSDIQSDQAALSMLLMKLIGCERLSHSDTFDRDQGLGLFAGLSSLPKPSYMTSYSCRMSGEETRHFQKQLISHFQKKYPSLYESDTINLDFHAIPHFGNESVMEKVWSGSRNKAIKGANTFVAQNDASNCIVYSNSDVPRKEASGEIKHFVDYWLDVKGVVKETLVFDSKLTNYSVLNELDQQGIKFITLRRRGQKLCESAIAIPDDSWDDVTLDIPKRKYKKVKVHERETLLEGFSSSIREIIITGHGRSEPTFIVTNNRELSQQTVLTIYAHRWHIENTLAELIHFFHLNALSSPIMIRIHFDMLWTIIAHTIYALLTRDLKGFEKCRAANVFRRFIDMPGTIVYDGESFTVKIRKHSITPILRDVDKLSKPVRVPWLDNKELRIEWTA